MVKFQIEADARNFAAGGGTIEREVPDALASSSLDYPPNSSTLTIAHVTHGIARNVEENQARDQAS